MDIKNFNLLMRLGIIGLYYMFTLHLSAQKDELPIYYVPHRTYTVKDGLSHNSVMRAFQDSKGYLWLGTREGINRFDGLEFTNHLNNPVYPDDFCHKIYQNKDSLLWLSGYSDIYQYDGYKFEGIKQHLPDSVTQYWTTKKNFVDDYLYFQNKQGKQQIYKYNHPFQFIKQEYSKSLSCDDGSRFLLNNNDESFIWCKQNGLYSLFVIKKNGLIKNPIPFQITSAMYIYTRKGSVYVVHNNNLYEYKNDVLILLKILEINYNHLTIRDSTFLVYDLTALVEIGDSTTYDFGLRFDYYTSGSYLDNKNNIWLPTDNGLTQIRSEAVEIYSKERGLLPAAWTVIEDNNGYLLSSFGNGMQRINTSSRYEEVHGYEQFFNGSDYLFYADAKTAHNGDILFPNQYGILIYDKNREFRKMRHSDIRMSGHNPTIQSIKEDDDAYYLATMGFTIIYKDGKHKLYTDADGLDMHRLYMIESMERDTSGIWWLNSHYGLAKFDGQTFQNYYVGEELVNGMNSVVKDYKGNLWFGSHDGLMYYDYSSELPQRIYHPDISGSVKSLTFIDSTYLMLGMMDRLIFVDLQKHYDDELNYFIFDEENGFDASDCIINGTYPDSKGNIWIATRENILKLMPYKLKLDNTPTPVIFDGLHYNLSQNEEKTIEELYDEKLEPILLTNKHNLEIHFHTINFINPKKIQYQYLLKGYTADWSPPNPSRSIYFSNLPVGKYELAVRTKLTNKYSEPSYLTIEIKPSVWYEALWVKPLGIIGLFGLVVGWMYQYYYRRLDAQKNEEEVLRFTQKEFEIRHKLLLNQANPHFTFNILQHIKTLVMKKQTDQAENYIGLFGELFRPMLDDDGRLTWSLRREIQFTSEYLQLEKLRFDDKFEYSIVVDDNVDLSANIPKMIIQSFVNNAIKHGIEIKKTKDGLVEVEVSQSGEILDIRIRDNGPGIHNTQTGNHTSGKGIEIVRSTLEWLNGQYDGQSSVEISSRNHSNTGTEVRLAIYSKYKNI